MIFSYWQTYLTSCILNMRPALSGSPPTRARQWTKIHCLAFSMGGRDKYAKSPVRRYKRTLDTLGILSVLNMYNIFSSVSSVRTKWRKRQKSAQWLIIMRFLNHLNWVYPFGALTLIIVCGGARFSSHVTTVFTSEVGNVETNPETAEPTHNGTDIPNALSKFSCAK